MTHICVNKLIIIGSDNGLLPGCRQAIIWSNVGILLIGLSGANFSEILTKIHTFSFKKMHLKILSGKLLPFCLGLNVLIKNWSNRLAHPLHPFFHPSLCLPHFQVFSYICANWLSNCCHTWYMNSSLTSPGLIKLFPCCAQSCLFAAQWLIKQFLIISFPGFRSFEKWSILWTNH